MTATGPLRPVRKPVAKKPVRWPTSDQIWAGWILLVLGSAAVAALLWYSTSLHGYLTWLLGTFAVMLGLRVVVR